MVLKNFLHVLITSYKDTPSSTKQQLEDDDNNFPPGELRRRANR